MATVAEAEQRVRDMEARIAYLEGLSVTDELTGLYNRRGFMSELDRALAAARRSRHRGALMIGDLDGFKQVNDGWGHNAGNEVLRQFAQLVAGKVRRSDTVGRLGGDEFGIILVSASLANGRRKAQALASAVADADFLAEGQPIRVGVSFGVAAFSGDEAPEEILGRADLAMYGDKRRNSRARTA
jgi:diguanylate cyclase (GGDEF)-like protein